jgi:hypothetical protein
MLPGHKQFRARICKVKRMVTWRVFGVGDYVGTLLHSFIVQEKIVKDKDFSRVRVGRCISRENNISGWTMP